MPLNHNEAEAVKDICGNDRYKDLRERFDETFAYYRLDPEKYGIPAEEGNFEKYIPAHAKTEGNKLVDLLSFAKIILKIELHAEDEKSRKLISNTEYTARGMLKLADDINANIPDYFPIQSQLAFYRVMRGWSAIRFIIDEDGDDIIPDLQIWDVRNLYWRTGNRKLAKVCYVRWDTKENIQCDYPKWNGDSHSYIAFDGEMTDYSTDAGEVLIPIYDLWDCSEKGKPVENGIVVGDSWVKEPQNVLLNGKTIDYLPIRISAGRSTPIIHDKKNDNIKLVGDDYLANTRELLKPISRLMSYKMESAGKQAKAPLIIEYDSNLSDLPKQIDEQQIDPDAKGSILFLDVAKGEKYADYLRPATGNDIDSTYAVAEGERSRGGLSAVAYGVINQALPAQGIDILGHATMDIIKPFKLGMEGDLAWLATQMVQQYQYGKYDEMEFSGYDDKDNPFRVTVKPDDVSDRPFTCELKLDLLRDRAAEIGNAATLVDKGITSAQTARDINNIVDDTDLEESKIMREKARALLGIGEAEAIVEMIDDLAETEDPKKFFVLRLAMDRFNRALMQENMQNNSNGQPVQGTPMPNQAVTRGAMASNPQIPEAIQQAAKLKNMGLVG